MKFNECRFPLLVPILSDFERFGQSLSDSITKIAALQCKVSRDLELIYQGEHSRYLQIAPDRMMGERIRMIRIS